MNGDILEILDDASFMLKENKNQIEVIKNYCNKNPEQKIAKIQSSIDSIFEKQTKAYEKLNQFSKDLFKELYVKK